MQPTEKKGQFQVQIGDGPVYTAEAVGATWNGWATPAFNLETMRQMAPEFNLLERAGQKGPEFVEKMDPEAEYPNEPEVLAPWADGLYRPDGWIWDVVGPGDLRNEGCPRNAPVPCPVCGGDLPVPANQAGIDHLEACAATGRAQSDKAARMAYGARQNL